MYKFRWLLLLPPLSVFLLLLYFIYLLPLLLLLLVFLLFHHGLLVCELCCGVRLEHSVEPILEYTSAQQYNINN